MQDKHNQRGRWLPIILLGAALVVWGGLLALGAYLEWGADRPERDPRKFWIVWGCVAGFLALWGTALWLREKRR